MSEFPLIPDVQSQCSLFRLSALFLVVSYGILSSSNTDPGAGMSALR